MFLLKGQFARLEMARVQMFFASVRSDLILELKCEQIESDFRSRSLNASRPRKGKQTRRRATTSQGHVRGVTC